MASPADRQSNRIILLIYEQGTWPGEYLSLLRAHDFRVYACDMAHARLLLDHSLPKITLVVLNCSSIGRIEEYLIKQFLACHSHMMVLCDNLSISMVRTLFLKGVDDVTNQPRSPIELAHQIDAVLVNIVPRNSYQALERESIS